MLCLPQRGVNRSRTSHNCDFSVLCDWVEATALFKQEETSQGDLVDELADGQVYVRDSEAGEEAEERAVNEFGTYQEMAWQCASMVWEELQRRESLLTPSPPFSTSPQTIAPNGDWRDHLAYAFCLYISASRFYDLDAEGVLRKRGVRDQSDSKESRDYNARGRLFERVSEYSLAARGWSVRSIGFSPQQTIDLRTAAYSVADFIREPELVNDRVVEELGSSKEAGVDLVCHRGFEDGLRSMPILLVQCASGKNYHNKASTPDVDLWGNIIPSTSRFVRTLTIPFAYHDREEFGRVARKVQGVLIERLRLVGVGKREEEWLPQCLREDLRNWLEPRVAALVDWDGV